MADSMTYVYAITLEPDPGVVHGLTGIGGSAVRQVHSAGITALVSTVAAAEFGEEGLRENLEDLRWLEKTVRDHNRVVDAVSATSPVAPFGLATVYYNEDRVRTALAERAKTFTKVLDQITGCTEWGVKAYADLKALTPAQETETATSGGRQPGTAYLKRLRQRRKGQDQAKEEAIHRAEEVHQALSGLARAERLHPPQNRELAGYEGLMVLNGAYLVDSTRNDEFTATVQDIAENSTVLRVELTGPWPAYSFSAFREDEEDR